MVEARDTGVRAEPAHAGLRPGTDRSEDGRPSLPVTKYHSDLHPGTGAVLGKVGTFQLPALLGPLDALCPVHVQSSALSSKISSSYYIINQAKIRFLMVLSTFLTGTGQSPK